MVFNGTTAPLLYFLDRGARQQKGKVSFCCCFRGKDVYLYKRGKYHLVLCFYALNCVECWKKQNSVYHLELYITFFISCWKHNAEIKDSAKE